MALGIFRKGIEWVKRALKTIKPYVRPAVETIWPIIKPFIPEPLKPFVPTIETVADKAADYLGFSKDEKPDTASASAVHNFMQGALRGPGYDNPRINGSSSRVINRKKR